MPITNPAGDPSSYPATVERRSDNEPRDGFWESTFDKLLNRTAWLHDQIVGFTASVLGQLASTTTTSSGTRLVGNEVHTGANYQGNLAASTLFALLGKIWDEKGNLLLRPRIPLTDANHTSPAVNVSQGDRFTLTGAPIGPRVIKLDSTSVIPLNGMTMVFLIKELTSSAQPAYTFQRDDTSVICTVNGSATGAVFAVSVEFEFAGDVWHIGQNSGASFDDNTFTVQYGVIPGVAA